MSHHQDNQNMSQDDIVARECRFAVHLPAKNDLVDLHVIKEIHHLKDGTKRPHLRFIKNYNRSFYVTRPDCRDHEQKKEAEHVSKLREYRSTQTDLRMNVAKALNRAWSRDQLRDLASSPYLYGTDITSTTLIKREYARKWPDAITPYKTMFGDIETDVVTMSEEPFLKTLVFEREIRTFVRKDFVKGYADVEREYQRVMKKYLGDYLEKYNYDYKLIVVEDSIEVIKAAFQYAHSKQPDFLAYWNMNFDVPKMQECLEAYGVEPKDVFSDPRVPPEYRAYKYKQGATKKVTANGKVKPMNPSEQWHSVHTPASFYIIDAMCAFRFIRQGSQEEASYSLGAILSKYLSMRKLYDFDIPTPGCEPSTLEWHRYMQQHHPFEYIVYNTFDASSMNELNNQTNDLSQTLPSLCKFTDFSKFNSQTKKIADRFHFYLEDKGWIPGTVPPREDDVADDIDLNDDGSDDDEEEELSEEEKFLAQEDVLGLNQWIVTLAAHLITLGQPLILEDMVMHTMIRAFAYDSDAVSSYPSCTAAANVSRSTTKKEIIDIQGIDEMVFRYQGINLLQGHVNALEYANVMYGLPLPQDMLKYFE